jgi:hypothetical protein
MHLEIVYSIVEYTFPRLLCYKNGMFYVIFPTNLAMCVG